jgi:hypothetical protein
MKHATRIWFSVCLLTLALGSVGAAFAQGTPDGVTPAVERICSDQRGASYGLCVAYCEAHDCDLEPGSTECATLRANYAKITGTSTFPCDGELK